MPKFEFTITAPATMSARVSVEAATIAEAQEIALRPSFYENPENARFEMDEENLIDNVYLPDEDDYEELPSSDDEVDQDNASPRL